MIQIRTLKDIVAAERIGITKAAEQAIAYIIAGNPYVSGPKSFAR